MTQGWKSHSRAHLYFLYCEVADDGILNVFFLCLDIKLSPKQSVKNLEYINKTKYSIYFSKFI